ncbi:hypothetical protein JCM8202_005846 [Rhodotorula sphaerocarpa]
MAALAPLVLSHGTAADCDPLADLNLRAFEPSLFHQRLFARTDRAELLSWTAERLRGKLFDEGYEVWKAERGGALVGEAVWSVPNAAAAAETSGEDPSAAARNFPAGTDLELARVLLPGRRNIPEPHFYLSSLAVAPEAQGTGVGTALLRRICERAEELEVDVHVKSSREGLSLYRRFGFEPAGEALRPESAPEIALHPLVRRPLSLGPATTADLPQMGELHRLAFAPTGVVRYLHINVKPEDFRAKFLKRFEPLVTKPEKGVVTVARRGDKVLGFAWSTREPAAADRPPEDKKPDERPELAGVDPVRSREFLGALDRHAKNVHFAHWNLHILSVDPTVQRAGVGRRLLQDAIDRAQSENLPLTLESTELGLPLYRATGFRDYAKILVAEQDPTVKLWPMVYGLPVE